jgi:hypothetical protein
MHGASKEHVCSFFENKHLKHYLTHFLGDEVVSREILLGFIELLLTEYTNGNETVKNLVNNAHIFVMPTMNPDGLPENFRLSIYFTKASIFNDATMPTTRI